MRLHFHPYVLCSMLREKTLSDAYFLAINLKFYGLTKKLIFRGSLGPKKTRLSYIHFIQQINNSITKCSFPRRLRRFFIIPFPCRLFHILFLCQNTFGVQHIPSFNCPPPFSIFYHICMRPSSRRVSKTDLSPY